MVRPLAEWDVEDAPNLALPEVREHFVIDVDAKAEWALRKLADIRTKRAEVHAIANAEIERVNGWLTEADAELRRDAEYFEGILGVYMRSERARDPKRKSIALPHGKISSRVSAAKPRVEDKDAFLAWAKENAPNLVVVKAEPSQSALNDYAVIAKIGGVDEETGEVTVEYDAAVTPDGTPIPGTRIDPETVTVTVDTV